MKDDEKVFFAACYMFTCFSFLPHYTIRDIVDMFDGLIYHKRCWYLLEKWSNVGFYNYGVTLDLGWFEVEDIPDRYCRVLTDNETIKAALDVVLIPSELRKELTNEQKI